MAATLQERVEALLKRDLVVRGGRGVSSSDIEAAAAIESVSTSLAIMPRTALYFGHLARNGLSKAVSDELSAIATIRQTISDLGNQTYAIRDTRSLERSIQALLEIEQQGRVDPTSGSFKNFEVSVRDFLNKQLSKNVRRLGSSDLLRPGGEAQSALPTEFEALKKAHQRTKNKLYWLSTGIKNFASLNVGGLLGLNTAFRSRSDLEAILQELKASPSGSDSRDHALRLIAARRSLRTIAKKTDLFSDKLNTIGRLPDGQILFAKTVDPVLASVRTTTSPWEFAAGASMSLTVDGVKVTSQFPCQGADLSNKTFIVTPEIPWPITVAENTNLFLRVDGVAVRVPLNATSSPTTLSKDDFISKVNAASQGLFSAVSFPKADSLRVAIYTSAAELAVIESMTEVSPESTVGDMIRWTRTAHASVGLPIGPSRRWKVPTELFAAVITELFAELGVVASSLSDGSISVSVQEPSRHLVAEFPIPMWVGSLSADTSSTKIQLVDENGADVSPVDLVDPGDTVTLGGFSGSVSDNSKGYLEVAEGIPWSPEAMTVSVVSCLVPLWQNLQTKLDGFLATWLRSGFQDDLDKIDRTIAPLYGSPTQARRNEATQALQVLEDLLGTLQTVLDSNELPYRGAVQEEDLATSIIQTLRERKFDRAVDFLLSCRLVETMRLDATNASYGAAFLTAASDIAQTDIKWPDRTKDEGLMSIATDGGSSGR